MLPAAVFHGITVQPVPHNDAGSQHCNCMNTIELFHRHPKISNHTQQNPENPANPFNP